MNTRKDTLELNCKITSFSILYKTDQMLWSDQETQLAIEKEDDEQVGYLKVWKEDIAPELIKENRLLLEEKIESFMLGMKFIGNRRLTRNQTTLYYYIDNEDPFHIRHDIDIEAIIRRSKGEEFNYMYGELPALQCNMKMDIQPSSLPTKMPNIPLILKRYILTIIQAEDLDENSENYQDEKLKRWFLILEELEENKNTSNYIDIKCARHFVSHRACNGQEVINFLKRELPSSVYINDDEKEEARFLRDNPSHISLISQYENKARNWARNLIKQQITSIES